MPLPEETTPLDYYGAGKVNGGRGTDRPGWHHPNWAYGAPTPTTPPKFFTGRMPFLPPNQQRQSTEGNKISHSGDPYPFEHFE